MWRAPRENEKHRPIGPRDSGFPAGPFPAKQQELGSRTLPIFTRAWPASASYASPPWQGGGEGRPSLVPASLHPLLMLAEPLRWRLFFGFYCPSKTLNFCHYRQVLLKVKDSVLLLSLSCFLNQILILFGNSFLGSDPFSTFFKGKKLPFSFFLPFLTLCTA